MAHTCEIACVIARTTAHSRQCEHFRKVYEHNGLIEERVYLGGYEVYRKHTGTDLSTATLTDEQETLHIADDARRVCMIETLTVDAGTTVTAPAHRNFICRLLCEMPNPKDFG